MNLIGLHIKSGEPQLFLEQNKSGTEVFQTFMPTKAENIPMFDFNHKLFIHAPYWNNLVKSYDDKKAITWKYIKFLLSRIYFMEQHDRKLVLVSHLGSGYQGDTIEDLKRRLKENLKRILKADANFLILLETEAGGKNKANFTFQDLNNLVDELNDPRIGICADTEHLYANGELIPEDWHNIKLLHLNSIPEKVEFGSHLDRHSDTLIQDGKELELLKNYYKKAIENEVPIIFERRNVELQLQDKEFVLRNW